ncbi:MAG: hypothetical protein NVSMB20_17370 [Bradyrhizobium sp.]
MDTADQSPDTLLLSPTRPAMIYRVPLKGFLLATFLATFAYAVTAQYNIFWRAGVCGGIWLLALYAMMRLTSWDQNWLTVLLAWGRTTGRSKGRRVTRSFGGSTFRPWPCDPLGSASEVRDYAG